MRRYLLFSGFHYYPDQGAYGCDGVFDDLGSAQDFWPEHVAVTGHEWAHVAVIDGDVLKIVATWECGDYEDTEGWTIR